MAEDRMDKIIRSFLDIIENYYPLAKRSLIDLEAKERLKALGAFTDLRDVFDHIYLAIKYAKSENIRSGQKDHMVDTNISSAYEHLRRATIEPFETALEDLLVKIIDKAKYNTVFYCFGISKVCNDEIRVALEGGFNVLREVRLRKGQLEQLPLILSQLETEYDQLFSFDKKLISKRARNLFGLIILSFMVGAMFGMSIIGAIQIMMK